MKVDLEQTVIDHFICKIMLNITFGDGWRGHDDLLPLRLLEIQRELLYAALALLVAIFRFR